MRVIQPVKVTDAILADSNVPEDDHAEWSVSTAYGVGDRVIVISTHSVYEAVTATTGDDPSNPANVFSEANPSGAWVRVGATNRWKAFDERLNDQVTQAETITYTLAIPQFSDGISFFNLAALSVDIVVRDASNDVVFEYTSAVVDTDDITDWFTFFTWEPSFQTEALVLGLPAFASHSIEIVIDNGDAMAAVGQIVFGRVGVLGTTMAGTEIGIQDFSTKERDTFGNVMLVQRAFAQKVTFKFHMPTGDERRVQRIVADLRATPTVYFSSETGLDRGTLIYGFYPDFSIPLNSAGISFATLEIEGLA